MSRTPKINAFENVPPLVPSQASNADVQRAGGTGVTSFLSPVSLPFFGALTHLIIYIAIIGKNEVLKRRNFANLFANHNFFINFAVEKLASWITQETHHEKPANNKFINLLKSTNKLWTQNP
jgi:hypothetical protein